MRIEELQIDRYGPLAIGKTRPGPFTLFAGGNEDGKTLLLESIVRLLLAGVKPKDFPGLQRVDEQPEGYLILRGENGSTCKLPERADEAPEGLLLDDVAVWRNVFVIRDSDLTIDEPRSFYTNVTAKLTGLRTHELRGIRGRLQELARITPATAKFKNDQSSGGLKDRIQKAKALIERIEQYERRVEEEGVDGLEERYAETDAALRSARERSRRMELARRWKRHADAANALSGLEQVRRRLEAADPLDDQEVERWDKCGRALERLDQREQQLNRDVSELRQSIEQLRERSRQRESELRTQQQRTDRAEQEVRPRLQTAQQKRESAAGLGSLQRPGVPLYVTAALAALAITGYAMAGGLVLGILALLLGTATLGLLIPILIGWRRLAGADREAEAAIQAARSAGLTGDDVDGLLQELSQAAERREQLRDQCSRLTADVEAHEKSLDKGRSELSNLPDEREKHAAVIRQIQRKTGFNELEEYRTALEHRRRREQELSSTRSTLRMLLGSPGAEDLDQQMAFWRRKLREIEPEEPRPREIDYEETEANALRQELERLDQQLSELWEQLEETRGELQEIGERANDVLQESRAHCSSTADVGAVREKLTDFVSYWERRREAALAAIGVLGEMERDEQDRVADLFGPDSRVSADFSAITGGRYRSVDHVGDDDGEQLLIRRADGTQLRPDQLSGGAYDQLYLSVRLALARKLLGGEPGFLLLDDPFIKADPHRLSSQMQVLKELTDSGWQILYFTAKREIREICSNGPFEERLSVVNVPGT